jgi:hypothetical protein
MFFNQSTTKIITEMKYLVLSLGLGCALAFTGCKDDEEPVQPEFEYHAHVHSPDASDKHIGDTLHIEVQFESHTGTTVHHVNVRIYNKATGTEVYNAPDDAHVHASSGEYLFEDTLILSQLNGFMEHTTYVFEAKVWGHDDGVEETTEEVEFHVEP